MENTNFIWGSPHSELLPKEAEDPWQHRKSPRGRKIFTFENALKAFAFLTVVSACFTSVACAIYSYHSLNEVQTIHQEILDLESLTENIKSEQSEPWAAPVTVSDTDTVNIDDSDVDEADDDSVDDDEWYDDDDNEYEYDDDEWYDDDDDDDEEEEEEEKEEKEEGEDYFEEDNSLPPYDETDDEFTGLDDSVEEGSGYYSDDEDYSRFRRSTDSKKGNNRKKGKTGGKGNNKKQQNNKKGGTNGRQKKLKSLRTAQFYANITVDDLTNIGIGYDAYVKTPDCNYNAEMAGVYCLNQTFTPDADKPLKLFKKEPWVDDRKSPVKLDGRKFVVKDSGTHLVYAQLLMEATQSEVNASIIRERKGSDHQRLTCTNDCSNSDQNSTVNFRCTCSIFGLMNLKTNDVLFVQVPVSDNKIILDERSTYMGIVQLNRD